MGNCRSSVAQAGFRLVRECLAAVDPPDFRSGQGRAQVLIAGFLAVISTGAFAADRSMTLQEATTMALEKNEGLIVQREAWLSADAAVGGASGPYDPLLDLQLGWRRSALATNSPFAGAPVGQLAPTDKAGELGLSLQRLLPTGGEATLRIGAARQTTDGGFALLSPAYATQVGLEIRQPLLRGRAVDASRLGLSVSSAERGRANAALVAATRDTVAAVERAFWGLVAAARGVEVRDEAVRLAEEQRHQTEIRIEGGEAPETEIAQPRAELERRRGELLASREEATRAENALKLLILADRDEALWLDHLQPAGDTTVRVVPVDLAAAMGRAMTSRPEIEEASKVVERRRAEAAFARDLVKPTLDAVVSYDRFGLAGRSNPAAGSVPGFPAEVPSRLAGAWGRSFGVLGGGDFEDARVALVLGVPIGNHAARAAAVVAGSAERQAEADLAAVRKAIRAEVLNVAAAVSTAGQRIEAARAAREAAEVQLTAERERFAVGLTTNFLVLTRQNDLARARLDEISALTDYRTARTELARVTGSLLEERGIAVQTSASVAAHGADVGGKQ